MKVSEVGEFGLIRRLREQLAADPLRAGVALGIGDDCAVLGTGQRLTLLTTDALVESVHFRFDLATPYEVGGRALAANLSDIAAMSGQPTVAVVAAGIPPSVEVETMEELYRGMADMAARFGASLVGGDTVKATDGHLWLALSVMGEVEKKRLVTRSGARSGDLLMVTGTLGDAAAGLLSLVKGNGSRRGVHQTLLAAHLSPVPRIAEMRAATSAGGVTAGMDLSDGLASDLHRLCEESKVGALVQVEALPISEACRKAAKKLGTEAVELALSGGEDFQLLLAVDRDRADVVQYAIENRTGTTATVIGEVRPPSQGVRKRNPDGSLSELVGGYRHF